MDKTVLDTDVFSEILKGRHAAVIQHAAAYHRLHGQYTIAIITVMEIIKGFHKVQREDRVQQFLANVQATERLPFDLAAAEVAGRIYADLERTGQPIGRADPMIAAIALRHNLSLTTGNIAHYQRIQALGYKLELAQWHS